jgi:hypothetical protein
MNIPMVDIPPVMLDVKQKQKEKEKRNEKINHAIANNPMIHP